MSSWPFLPYLPHSVSYQVLWICSSSTYLTCVPISCLICLHTWKYCPFKTSSAPSSDKDCSSPALDKVQRLNLLDFPQKTQMVHQWIKTELKLSTEVFKESLLWSGPLSPAAALLGSFHHFAPTLHPAKWFFFNTPHHFHLWIVVKKVLSTFFFHIPT